MQSHSSASWCVQKKPLLVLIVESRGFFGSANNASCLDNAFVCIQSLHLRIPPRVLHFSAHTQLTITCGCVIFYMGGSHTVDNNMWLCYLLHQWVSDKITMCNAVSQQITNCTKIKVMCGIEVVMKNRR